MPKRLIKIKSQYSSLLSHLVASQSASPYTIIEAEGSYYLSFSDSIDQGDIDKAKQAADVVIAHLNAIFQLPPFRVTKALERESDDVITVDDNGNKIGQITRDIAMRVGIAPDLTTIDFSNLLKMEEIASKLSRIKEALHYYGQGASWFNLFDVYECIKKDIKEVEGEEREIPGHWLVDSHGKYRLKDFTESANNANISGYAARHTYAESKAIESINDRLVKLTDSGDEIVPMLLGEATTFIEKLLVQWLKYRGIHF
ncbi:MAG TPA: hypothetical protein VJ761_22155 [Ktedonobacteraceae bacterium]|nr:hypothetical protein [Ktedonobacteraceae bacterium]